MCSYSSDSFFVDSSFSSSCSLDEDSSMVFSFLNWFSLDPRLLSSFDCPAFLLAGFWAWLDDDGATFED